MSAILKRIKNSFELSLNEINTEDLSSKESIATKISDLSDETRAQLLLHQAKINIEYSVLCSQIASEWSPSTPDLVRREQLDAALKTAELLEVLYRDYLIIPREVDRLQKEQRALRYWLYQSPQTKAATPKRYASKTIRETTSNVNLPRLFAVRARRLLMAIVPLTDNLSPYRQSMGAIDRYAAPFFTHLAWLYFIPRITNDLAMIFKHTVKHPWMSKKEQELGWETRLKIQFLARWPELSNDVPWFIANMVSCFIFVGHLLPYGMVLSVGMQVYEVAQVCALRWAELRTLHQQLKVYEQLLNDNNRSEESAKIESFIKSLNKRIQYESKRLWIPIINTTVLLLAIILATPFFGPAFAVAGGVIAVLATIVSYAVRKYIESQKPADNLFQLLATPSNTGFFSSPSESSPLLESEPRP